jgi:hypothetical protein
MNWKMNEDEQKQSDCVMEIAREQSDWWRMHVGLTLVAGTHLMQCIQDGLCAYDVEEHRRITDTILEVLRSHYENLLRRQAENN